MSYLWFDGFTLKLLCIARANRGTCKALGLGIRRYDVALARVHASPPRLPCAPPYHDGPQSLGVSTTCVSTAHTSRPRLGQWSRVPCGVRALTATPSIRPPRPHAERRTRALTRRSLHCEAMMPPRVLGYKKPPPSPPARESADRHPPLPPLPRWPRTSACSRRRPNPPSPPLGPSRAPIGTHWASPPWASPEPEPQWARRRNLAATARWGHLPPSHHRQSTHGEPNHTPTPHVFLLQPPFTAGEPSPAAKGTVVKSRGYMCKPGTQMQWKLS
jgi:hypothetical protein